MEMDIKRLPAVKRWLSFLLPGGFAACTFFIFGMLTIYFANLYEFWFSLRQVLLVALPCFLTAFALNVLIGGILPKRIGKYWAAILFGLGIAMLLQSVYLFNSFGALDGGQIDWSAYKSQGVIGAVVWVVCLTAPPVLVGFFEKTVQRLMRVLCVMLICLQIGVVGVKMLRSSVSWKETEKPVLTTKDMWELSESKNVVVFILDTFCRSDLDVVLPQYADMLDGFTYYDNVVSAYGYTQLAIPQIVTGQGYYNEQPYAAYVQQAAQNAPLLNELERMEYRTGIYTGSNYIGAHDGIDNQFSYKSRIRSLPAFAGLYAKLTAFSLAPQWMKQLFWMTGAELAGQQTVIASETAEDLYVYQMTDPDFYLSLHEFGLQTASSSPVFRFYHLNGAHSPFIMDEHASANATASSEQQMLGSFFILDEYFSQMKSLEIYDDATIVIAADHGAGSLRNDPIMMIKRPGSAGEMVTDSTPASYFENLQPTLLDLIGGDTDRDKVFGHNDGADTNAERYSLLTIIQSAANYIAEGFYYAQMEIAVSESPDQFILTGKVYAPGEVSLYPVSCGDRIPAKEFARISSIGLVGADHVFSESQYTILPMQLESRPNGDIRVTVKAKRVIRWPGRVTLYVSNNRIGSAVFTEQDGSVSFLVPAELLPQSNVLILTFLFEGGGTYAMEWDSLAIERAETAETDAPAEPHGMQLVPYQLSEGKTVSDGIILYTNGVAHGQYMTLPAGQYRLRVTGERLEPLQFIFQGNSEASPEPITAEEQRSDGEYSCLLILPGLTSSANFVLANYSAEPMKITGIFLEQIDSTEP